MYEYDAFQRNTKVETFDGNIQINRYDAEGLRHEVEENGTLISYLYRGTEVVVEETKEETIRYIRTNELVASDAESARTYYHYASDELGSITHVTEESNILNHYEYDAWGNATICEETVKNRFRFNGQQYDPVSQQYYLRARYYNPVIGRFTQEDTYRGDGLNLYAYCRNNPVYYVDPSGHEACPAFVKRIRKEIAKRTASKAEVKKLSRHLREKVRTGQKLNRTEKKAAKQLGIDYGGRIHNPYGKKGGSAHQRVIDEIKVDADKRGFKYGTEYRFDTTGGYKNSRYADVVLYDSQGRVMEIHQVGRTTKKYGAPVSRERKAIRDIRSSEDYKGAKIIYHAYDR